MFLLFASVHGAAVLLEEREAGILDRILAGPGGMAPVLAGKFLFLVLSGYVQVTMIYIVAWLIRGVDLPGHFVGYSIVTLAAAIAASGLGLALTGAVYEPPPGRQRQHHRRADSLGPSAEAWSRGSSCRRCSARSAGLHRTPGLSRRTRKFSGATSRSRRWPFPWAHLCSRGSSGLVVARQLLRRWECV